MAKFIKKVLPPILSSLIGIAVALLIGELIIRLFYPQVTSPVQFFYDEKLGGVVPVPNQKGFKKFPDVYYYEYQNNNIGMRDKRNVADYQKYANRILCIGDSFTYGWGVNDDETFSRILEKKINKDSIAVLNAGTSGVGTDYVLKFLQVRGQELKPNSVIYFYFDNDMTDNMANAYFHIENDSIIGNDKNSVTRGNALKKNKLINNSLYNFLSSYSQLFGLVRYNLGVIWNKRVEEENRKNSAIAEKTKSLAPAVSNAAPSAAKQPVATPVASINKQDSLYHTYKYLSAAKKEAEKLGAQFLMFYIPSHISLQELQQSGKIGVEQSLKKYCEENRIDFYSFAGQVARAKNPIEAYYLPVDYHWNKDGHALAGNYIYEVLKQKGIVP